MDEEKTAEKQRQADEEAKEAGKEGGADPVEPVYKYEPKTTVDWAVQNDNKPLWTRSPKEVRGDGCGIHQLAERVQSTSTSSDADCKVAHVYGFTPVPLLWATLVSDGKEHCMDARRREAEMSSTLSPKHTRTVPPQAAIQDGALCTMLFPFCCVRAVDGHWIRSQASRSPMPPRTPHRLRRRNTTSSSS